MVLDDIHCGQTVSQFLEQPSSKKMVWGVAFINDYHKWQPKRKQFSAVVTYN